MQFPQRYISFKNFRFLVYHKERFQALKQFKIIQCFTPTKKERLNTKRESSMIYDLVTSQNFLANLLGVQFYLSINLIQDLYL